MAEEIAKNSYLLVLIIFSANKSIPLLKQISQKLEFNSEFSPSPERTLRLIEKTYNQKITSL